jgi:di/tricarboxylate transporter
MEFRGDDFRERVKPLYLRGKIALAALAALFFIILVPEILHAIGLGNAVTDFMMRMTVTTWAILMVVLLCLIRVEDNGKSKPVLEFAKAVKDVPLGLLLFIAAVLFVGSPIGAESAGIITWVYNTLGPIVGMLPMIGVVAMLCLIAIILTNFLASTVVVTILFILVSALFVSPGYGIAPTAIAILMLGSFAGCMGVLLPASTASTALYYGEHIEVRNCLKINVIYLALTFIAIIALTPLVAAVFV